MLHKDYDSKGSVAKRTGREPQEAWRQNELIGCKLLAKTSSNLAVKLVTCESTVGGKSPAGKDVNTEAGKSTLLEP
jgi:hypothetical protein